jgi:hypothetical protein
MYLVTAKRGGIELRDGSTAADPMHKLNVGEPVLFHNIPCGYRVPGDGQVSVVVAPERCEDIPAVAPVPMPSEDTPTPMVEALVLELPRKGRKGRKG